MVFHMVIPCVGCVCLVTFSGWLELWVKWDTLTWSCPSGMAGAEVCIARAIQWLSMQRMPWQDTQSEYKLEGFQGSMCKDTLEGLQKLSGYNLECSGTLYMEGALASGWSQGGAQTGGPGLL